MTTLITGAGLIGASFARLALTRGERLVFVDPEPRRDYLRFMLGSDDFELERHDVRDLPALLAIARRHAFDTVVHTAGLIGARVQHSLSSAFDINLGGTRNVAELVRLCGVRRLVHISTYGVYDRRLPAPAAIDEDFPRGGARGYGVYKGAQELVLQAYAGAFGFELAMLRPANVFGVGHFWSGSSGGRKLQNLALAGIDRGVARFEVSDVVDSEYIYSPDVGRAVDLAATVNLKGLQTFNIGAGEVTPFADLTAAAVSAFPGVVVDYPEPKTTGARVAPLNIARAAEGLGWAPQFTLAAAFADYAATLARARRDLPGFS